MSPPASPPPAPAGAPRRGARAALGALRLYQRLRAGRPTPSRYVPGCSDYAHEALARHGLGRGGLLAARRVARCHPWAGHGLDPVPE